MIAALMRALAELPAPPLRRVVGLSLVLAVASFAALWVAVGTLLYHASLFAWRPLDWLVDLLGGLGVAVLSWLLFPAIVTAIMSLFLDGVAAAVEARDYPGRGPARRAPVAETVAVMLRLTGAAIALNLLALPMYLFLPGINLLLFLAMNGYLLGRGYFEAVALRRLDAASVRAVRRRFAGRVFLGGVIIAGLFALPVVNLAAPVIATAFMVHVFEGLPRGALGAGGC